MREALSGIFSKILVSFKSIFHLKILTSFFPPMTHPTPRWLSSPSASTDRAELPVQTNSTCFTGGLDIGFPVRANGSAINARRSRHRTAFTRAAVRRQVRHQRIHLCKRGAVNQAAAVSLLRDQPGVHQFFEVKRQRRRRDLERLRQRGRRHAVRARYHQRAKHLQARSVGKCGQRGNGID